MGKVKYTSRTSRRIGGRGKLWERWNTIVEESVEGKVMGKVKYTSRTSRRIGGMESHGKGERH